MSEIVFQVRNSKNERWKNDFESEKYDENESIYFCKHHCISDAVNDAVIGDFLSV